MFRTSGAGILVAFWYLLTLRYYCTVAVSVYSGLVCFASLQVIAEGEMWILYSIRTQCTSVVFGAKLLTELEVQFYQSCATPSLSSNRILKIFQMIIVSYGWQSKEQENNSCREFHMLGRLVGLFANQMYCVSTIKFVVKAFNLFCSSRQHALFQKKKLQSKILA